MSDDAMARFQRASENLRDGNYEAALADFKLLHDNPNDNSYNYGLLRRGFVLAAWVTMGRNMYPEALVELEKVLDSKIKRQLAGDKDKDLQEDILAIQKYLNEIPA